VTASRHEVTVATPEQARRWAPNLRVQRQPRADYTATWVDHVMALDLGSRLQEATEADLADLVRGRLP
jgi:hypothetical protein